MIESLDSQPKRPLLQLKITLIGFEPAIWRRVLVASDATFFDLHSLIQDVFGWEDEHLHSFRIRRDRGRHRTYIQPAEQNDHDQSFFLLPGLPVAGTEKEEYHDELSTRLSQFLNPDSKTIEYEYDFGDSWRHTIKYEKQFSSIEHAPAVIDGERQGPPEDSAMWVGGAEAILKASRNKKSAYWRQLVQDWGADEANYFARMARDFLRPLDITSINITNPRTRLRDYR